MTKNKTIKLIMLSFIFIALVLLLNNKTLATTEGNWSYIYSNTDEGNIITKYTGNEKEVEVPEILGGKIVVTIGEKAFEGNTNTEKIVLPESVNDIYAKAFLNCKSLKEVVFKAKNDIAAEDNKSFKGCPDNLIVYTYENCSKFIQHLKNVEKVKYKEMIDLSSYNIEYIEDQTYTGKKIKPSVHLLGKNANLKKGKDYIVSYSENVNIGTAIITIKGTGKICTGELTRFFSIVPSKVQGVKAKTQTKNTVTLKWNKNSEKVTGYHISCYNYDNEEWDYVGETKSLSYKVKNLTEGTKYKFSVVAYKIIDETEYVSKNSSSVRTATKTKTPKISNISVNKNKVNVNINKVSGASGYQIQYSTDKKFKNNSKTVNVSKKSTSKTISKLKSKKRYYFRIRSYKIVDGKKIYSSYSEKKSVKIK